MVAMHPCSDMPDLLQNKVANACNILQWTIAKLHRQKRERRATNPEQALNQRSTLLELGFFFRRSRDKDNSATKLLDLGNLNAALLQGPGGLLSLERAFHFPERNAERPATAAFPGSVVWCPWDLRLRCCPFRIGPLRLQAPAPVISGARSDQVCLLRGQLRSQMFGFW